MKKVFAVIALVLLSASACFALSDAEYLRMKKNNADFRKADQRLTQVWKKLKGSLSGRVFAELQALQNDWISFGRDEEAQEYINEGYSRAEAYTMATNERADDLPDIADTIVRKVNHEREYE